MPAENEFLLYTLGNPSDLPLCGECGRVMVLARIDARPSHGDVSNFRCEGCKHSEMFIDDSGAS
jgi:hypothetical protein